MNIKSSQVRMHDIIGLILAENSFKCKYRHSPDYAWDYKPVARYTAVWRIHGFKTTKIFRYTVSAVQMLLIIFAQERLGVVSKQKKIYWYRSK